MSELMTLLQSIDLSLISTALQALSALGLLWPMVKATAFWLAFLWIFMTLFIAVMGVYRAYQRGHLKKAKASLIHRIYAMSLVAIGYIWDVTGQYTIANLVFWDLPAKRERLVTARMKRYVRDNTSPRRVAMAKWLCHQLDLYDQSGDHCGLRSAV